MRKLYLWFIGLFDLKPKMKKIEAPSLTEEQAEFQAVLEDIIEEPVFRKRYFNESTHSFEYVEVKNTKALSDGIYLIGTERYTIKNGVPTIPYSEEAQSILRNF